MTEQGPPFVAPPQDAPPPEAAPVDPAAASAAAAPMSVPYRVIPPEEALAPAAGRRLRGIPVLAPACWTFGVLLWSFTSMGALVTMSKPGGGGPLVEEGIGVTFVIVAVLVAVLVSIRRSLEAAPTRGPAATAGRSVIALLLAVPAWFIVTMIAGAVGRSATKNLDVPITIGLLGVGVAAVFVARRLLAVGELPRTAQQRVIAGALWIVGVLVTLAAVIGTLAGD
jgi:hypothetical protein